jgi:hypothetical protein
MSRESTIRDRIRDLFAGGDYREFTFSDLLDRIGARDKELLAAVLAQLARQHEIDKVVQVKSPETQTTLNEFPSVIDVPAEVHDIYVDRWRTVTPDMLRVVYKKHAA